MSLRMAQSSTPILPLLLFAIGNFWPRSCLACRYNVRETGFVDLGAERYLLFCYAGRNTPIDSLSAVEEVARAALRDSPIALQMVPADVQQDHPALKYRKGTSNTSAPGFVLVSPDERSRPIPVQGWGDSFRPALQTAFRQITSSRFRETLIQHVARHYAVVLLLEGPNAAANAKAREAAKAAIGKISRQMKFMSKPVARGPVLLTLGPASFSEERILLWSLGVENELLAEPHAAVLYGRVRRIGPLVKGREITPDALYNILAMVGADCECGLDPRLIRGIGLPVQWNKQTRAVVSADLGFDPDNPMVITEVAHILKIRATLYPEPVRDSAAAAADDPFIPFVEDNKPVCPRVASANPLLARVAYVLSGAAALVVLAAVWIVVRARRRNSCA